MNASARRGRRPRSSSSGDDGDGGLARDSTARPPRSTRPARGSAEARAARDASREAELAADPEAVARSIVLRQLSMTAKTRSELETTLAKRDVPAEVVTKVLDRMAEVGLIDDAAYANEWVRQRQSGRGLSRRALANELRRKGVDDDLAADALATVDDDAERERAIELATRRARASRGQPHDKRVRSLAGMLARKGYGSGVAFSVVREVLAAEGAELEGAEELFD